MIQYWFMVNCHFVIAWQNITLVKWWKFSGLQKLCLSPCCLEFHNDVQWPLLSYSLPLSMHGNLVWGRHHLCDFCYIIWPRDFANITEMGDVREIENQLLSWRTIQVKQRMWGALRSWQPSLTADLTETHLSVL